VGVKWSISQGCYTSLLKFLFWCVFLAHVFGLCTSYIFLLFAKFCWSCGIPLWAAAAVLLAPFLCISTRRFCIGSRFGRPMGRLGIADTVARGYRAFPHRQIYYFTPCILLLLYNFNPAPSTQAWSCALGKLLWENAFASQRNRLACRGRGFGMPAGCFIFAWCRRAILSFRVDVGSM
jgi:hypothetical protein